ncbi:MAG: fibronectin type III domain-containing protein [Steroidobacteraceae bacterium]|jgi:hypothetical protein|nr:fibronectin type III domain-containing protein [Steroidobacteraceae bacterium]
MVRARRAWIGVAAVATLGALVGTGWLMMRSRDDAADQLAPPPVAPRAQGPGTARLSWDAVDPGAYGADAKGDPVAGFRVYVGPSPEQLRLEASIDDPRATGYVVRNLPRGTWYYTVTTYTALGIESERPPPVSKTIR